MKFSTKDEKKTIFSMINIFLKNYFFNFFIIIQKKQGFVEKYDNFTNIW